MEDKKKNIPKDEKDLQDPENIIRNSEADTEGIVDFMHEEIKKRPMNRRKFLRMARETMAVAVLFGVVSCLVFAILLPIVNNVLNPDGNCPQDSWILQALRPRTCIRLLRYQMWRFRSGKAPTCPSISAISAL